MIVKFPPLRSEQLRTWSLLSNSEEGRQGMPQRSYLFLKKAVAGC